MGKRRAAAMWRGGNIRIKRTWRRVDMNGVMSDYTNNRPVAASPGGEADAPPTPGPVMRELGNLLDVSLRNVSVALRRIAEHGDGQTLDGATVRQLRDADWSLRRMAGLMTRWQRLGGEAADAASLGPNTALSAVVEEAVACVAPLLERKGVGFEPDIAPDAAEAPAGTLQPVLISGIQHAAREAGEGAVITLHAALIGAELEICIGLRVTAGETAGPDQPAAADPNAAPNPDAETADVLGMAVCRDIIRAMNGVLHYDEPTDRRRGATPDMLIRIPLGGHA